METARFDEEKEQQNKECTEFEGDLDEQQQCLEVTGDVENVE